MLSISQNFRVSVRVSVRLSVRLFTFRYRLNVFLPPLPKVPVVQNLEKFRYSESLGKSNGKKWSQILPFLFGSCLKLPRKKKCYFADFAVQNMLKTTLPDG